MLALDGFTKIYLYRPFIDFRKGIDGLCGIVQEQMKLDPFEKYLFVFCSSKRSKLKILYWDDSGFCLWYKRLEVEKFSWPQHIEEESLYVEPEKLKIFLTGLDPWKKPHKKLSYSQT
jgi:transposase